MPAAKRTTLKDSPSPRKRARGKTSASTSDAPATPRFRGRGQLKMLPEMPLDILFEIFSHLEPPDVLRLSRTTKDLRLLLMSHSAISIWKSAFLNDPDLPELPEGLNEPQYANLAFSPHCHSCFVDGEHSILWAFNLRLCQKCAVERFDEIHKVFKKLPGHSMMQNLNLLRCGTANLPTGIARVVYSHEEAAEINEQLIQLKKGDASKLEEFVAKRKEVVEAIQSLAAKAVISGQLRLARKQRLLQEARERRKDEICKRLSDLGYGDEVQFLKDTRPEALSEHTLIKSDTVLTGRVWENAKPKLVALMQSVTEKMQRRKRKALLKNRQRFLLSILKQYNLGCPIDEINPRAVDICVLPHIKAILEDPSMDTYTTEEHFQEVVDLPRLSSAWREEKTLSLLPLLPGGSNRDLLLRATTYFRCASCDEPIAYPRILAHACLSELQHGHRNRDDDITLLCVRLDSEPWNYDGKRVAYYPAAEVSARSVLQGCGLDAGMTTVQDMDDVNPWIECVRCSHKVRGRAVFRWRKAILHDMYHAASSEPVRWRLLNETDAEAAEALQAQLYETDYRHNLPEYACTKCRDQFSYLQMRGHLRISHGISDPRVEEDFVLTVDASMDQPPFPLMLPHAVPEVIELLDDDDGDTGPAKSKSQYGNSDCIVIDSD
ncbi:hypothetical protein C8F04DRAFT_1062745 [Mycena alexandri]|uniref:F-box domain-containing protein n=1 Tax=Mycena alexandri TaxID=1745969 RepID=A0AAD6TMY6_9AGAR|nr:hypothetical protein C8F04DRAFT_1062745 [Mycena alexandri]